MQSFSSIPSLSKWHENAGASTVRTWEVLLDQNLSLCTTGISSPVSPQEDQPCRASPWSLVSTCYGFDQGCPPNPVCLECGWIMDQATNKFRLVVIGWLLAWGGHWGHDKEGYISLLGSSFYSVFFLSWCRLFFGMDVSMFEAANHGKKPLNIVSQNAPLFKLWLVGIVSQWWQSH